MLKNLETNKQLWTITGLLIMAAGMIGALDRHVYDKVLMITGFSVIFPLGLGEIAKPYYGLSANVGSMVVSFAFSAFMLTVGFLHLGKMRLVH